MMIARTGTFCDITETRYEKPVMGVSMIARGATGRWCEVLWCGPEEAERLSYNLLVIPEAEAYAKAEADGYADF